MSLNDKQRAVLQMLAASPRGYSLFTVIARGFPFEMLQGLVRAGLVITNRDAVGRGQDKSCASADHRSGTEVDRGMKVKSPAPPCGANQKREHVRPMYFRVTNL
jgi:hypothetical protein